MSHPPSSQLHPAVRPVASSGRLLAWSLVVAGLMTSFAVGHLAGESWPAADALEAPRPCLQLAR